ncbi:MAG: dehydrogenase [Candidatus Rokubacteria bacterium 13_1_20CM_4_70_14]|nr:MAG: dehydrogenase [Candidatus Rokubacteria bacterium 13_2_20CM_70_12]OLD75169.1 MAG: dehydrogenase [Candidatus Rokubacteria bacterium 13_1_20CM_4_70_14]PYM46319.1 MAG: dehydrogenase [Candidatus Rokubacteria bacterium]
MTLSGDALESLYTTMVRIRRFDEKTTELFSAGLVKGTAHSYVGEEAVAAGACANLREGDYIVGTHRGHGHCIAKGARVDRMMAELMGRADGYCRGLGGSMHIAALDLNILGCNGIVAAGLPIGTGAALAAKLRKTDNVVVAFFGDGGANQGVVHEALNLAAVWKLPAIYLCENNQYALSTATGRTTAGDSIAARAAAYGIPGVRVDGNDVLAVYETVRTAVARARRGEGPTLVEAVTYRWGGHSMRANLPEYRTKEEEREWMERDPVARLGSHLVDGKRATPVRLKELEESVELELDRAVEFAKSSPEPTVELMEASVYAPHAEVSEPATRAGRELTMAEALNEALQSEMQRDERVFVMGEDVGLIGGIFGVTRGLRERFGEDRVRDTPISEATFVGAGVGAAIAGLRPVVEIQIFDFVALTMDQLVNQAAKFRYMLGGRPTVPLVIRGPQGGGIRLAAQHSQSLEAWFAHVPGLVVVAPATPYDAKGLLVSAIRDDNPVIFLEHKALYATKGAVPEAPYAIPLGKADVKRAGTDVTLVATQAMVSRALAAAGDLEKDGVSVEVIDPRTLVPLDEATILASVARTGRLVIAHEAVKRGGWGAELAALVAEHALDVLDAPIVRVAARNVPMPYNDSLERATIPSQQDIAAALRGVVA